MANAYKYTTKDQDRLFRKKPIQRAQALDNIKKSAPVETNTSLKLYYKYTMTNPTTYDDSFLYIVMGYKIYIVITMHKRSIFKHFRAVILNNFIKN